MKDYKKILEDVVDIINATEKSDIGFVNICTYIGENCPELKESEDEKIRKKLLSWLKNSEGQTLPIDRYNAAIAWLEKQGEQKSQEEVVDNLHSYLYGEQKPVDKVEPKFKKGDRVIGIISGMPYYISGICEDHYETESGCIIMFCSQDNFKLYKQDCIWSEEDERIKSELVSILLVSHPDRWTEYANWLKSIKDKCLPQQEWSEEDKRIWDIVWDMIDGKFAVSDSAEKEAKGWFISLKDRFVPQPKQEWNEEDEKMFYDIVTRLHSHPNVDKTEYDKSYHWLKSLRPQNRWKPSDEQMEALAWALSLAKNCGEENAFELRTVYEQLKKIREE